ncbi:Ca2+-transporting ATPase [Roseovarius marisflavi]|uniref:P-type Cu(+) transporter n=1 Tax=Roseovarius marisflavi TaxID=1054996 RepID=A0A1M7B8Z8_9RHOB|nr:cation-transporting P-type ATPase [Roseovarius marisflavi]SHL51460.1 Ca2+-transporting ATPase [Roseovarius marisflavi]
MPDENRLSAKNDVVGGTVKPDDLGGIALKSGLAYPHATSATDLIALLETSGTTGLSEAQAAARLAGHGPNILKFRERTSGLRLLIHQFESPVVLLLAGAAAIAFAFGEWKEGIAIGLVLVINSLIGFVTEWRAARSMEALRVLGSLATRLKRDGRAMMLPATKIVPGDIVLLEGGDVVTADIRLIEASNLSADESALTGESVGVDKAVTAVDADSAIGDRPCMLFKGTSITRGSGIGVVVATGMQSELGRISKLVEQAMPEHSPLERQLQRLSGQLITFTLGIVVLLGVLGVLKGGDVFLMIEASIALAVAAIPEGLPVVATMALARGMWRMARQNALIERLSAVETLGATTVIFTDKTGTLTENKMTVREIGCPGAVYAVSDRAITLGDETIDAAQVPCLDKILTASVLCNNAELGEGDTRNTGDPLEQALLLAASAAAKVKSDYMRHFPKLREIAFDSTTKLMATIHQAGDQPVMWVKGAPEAVLDACTEIINDDETVSDLSGDLKDIWQVRTNEMAARGMRVLAVATKGVDNVEAADYAGLTFLGLIGLVDPPRSDVPGAIAKCRSAGIRVIMMTGDHAVTAKNIATAVGLADHDPAVIEGRCLPQVTQMSDNELNAIRSADVFARVSPEQKLYLISLCQKDGEIVAMTGDGVNDAPALRQADIGIAMGLRGTQVAREAADMVLRDDAFGSIVAAIREGRVIFRNIQKFVTYLLSCNLSEVLVVGIAILSGLPLPLLPLQILFLNLVTDVFPAFALGTSEGSDKILQRPPRDPGKPIVTRAIWLAIVLHSLSITAATLGALVVAMKILDLPVQEAVTVSFLTLAFAQLWHVFNMRDPRSGLILNEVTRNKFVWGGVVLSLGLLFMALFIPVASEALELHLPDATSWGLILGMSLVPLIFGQTGLIASAIRHRGASRQV